MTRNLKFHKKIYLGESIEPKKVDKLKRKLRVKPFLAPVFLIVPARNPNDMLDIFDARQLVQKYYEKESFVVLGIAGDYSEALRLVERMVQDCLKERGDCRLREYLLC
ncbi:MAG: hypothetical protein J6A94_12295 [Lachnospiraceae bacterium]|nr:hypothetical protein [Lachnospiraceae bacterium]